MHVRKLDSKWLNPNTNDFDFSRLLPKIRDPMSSYANYCIIYFEHNKVTRKI